MTERKIIGTIELASKYRYGITSHGAPIFLFRPYDEAEPEYIVGSSERDLTRNQIAVVAVTTPAPLDDTQTNVSQTKPRGHLVKLFGPVGDPTAEREALLSHYCPFQNKKDVEPLNPDETDDDDRIEIDEESGWITFHIDPPGCRDIDDAIAYNPETKAWAITIADAAAAVPSGSWADLAASAIGSTFYDLEGKALRPMLPATISEDSASLLPGKRRRGVTLIIADDGSSDFVLSWITVDNSFTYDSFISSYVQTLLPPVAMKDPHVWIEELMIRYNKEVATRLKHAGTGLLRVQQPAAAAEVASWSSIDPALSIMAAEAATYEVADTESVTQGHASLGLDAYCHASSPLRRYADLFNQRVLKGLLRGDTEKAKAETDDSSPFLTASILNKRTRANRRWTRDLTFLSLVIPGRVHIIDVIFLGSGRVWVPAWRRILRLRHIEDREPGFKGRINIFCDPTKRNWSKRVLTAAVTFS
jgi:exoribonuclease R